MPLHVFVSYALPDERAFARLAQHLSPLVRAKTITLCSRRDLMPGLDVAKEIRKQLDEADLVLMLCSIDYLAAEDSYSEMLCAVARRLKGVVDLLPIRWGACQGEEVLNSLPALPRTGAYVQQLTPAEQDEAWQEVADYVRARAASPRVSSLSPTTNRLLQKAFERERQLAQAHGFIIDEPQDLACDRSEQWHALDVSVQNAEHAAFLLPGKQGQGHRYFNLRVLIGLRRDPPREVIWLAAHGHIPRDEASYRDSLARALQCAEAQLSGQLRSRMSQRNLVLLHPPADGFTDASAIRQCLREWLPRLIDEAVPHCYLKCIQPIEWQQGLPGPLTRINRLLFPEPRLDALADFYKRLTRAPAEPASRSRQSTREQSMKLVAELQAPADHRARGPLLIRPLAELSQIRKEHVNALCDILGIREPLRSEFTRRVFSPNDDSEAILQLILKETKDFKNPRPNQATAA